MRPTLTVSSTGDLSFLRAAVGDLQKAKTYIGIPEKKTDRQRPQIGPLGSAGEYITNAGLLYIHTNGSQLHNIPRRPVIEPSIQVNRLQIESQLFKVAQLRLDGKYQQARTALAQLGTFAADNAKLWFTDPRNGWAQNAPKTIERKLGKLIKSSRGRKRYLNAMTILYLVQQYRPRYGTTPLDSINTPLIDTGELQRAITHVESI